MVGWPNQAILSFSYNIVIFGMAALLILTFRRERFQVGAGYVVLLAACNHIGIIMGFSLGSGPESFLWPADTLDHHLPNAIAFSEWMSGSGDIAFSGDNPFSVLYVSNMWVGFFFLVFGIYPVVSAYAMLLIKLLTVVLIYRAALNISNCSWIAITAALIYGLMPTVTFYTLQFYKDFFIHFLVALLLYFFSKSHEKPSIAALMVIPLSILVIERFYLVIMICVALTAYFFTLSGRIFQKLAIFILAALTVYFVLGHYFAGQGISDLLSTINDFASAQNQSEGVTPTTNLALDMFRAMFTPFFNFYKLDFYMGLDSILIFAGFIHGIVMLLYLRGIWVERKRRIVMINIAFLILLIILALVMPYAGRARDSLYPLLSIFAAIGLGSLLDRKSASV